MTNLNGLIQCSFAKDLNFRFSSCSEALAEMGGCDSPQQIIGKDDYQLIWRRDGDFFREKDIAILKGAKCYTQLESIETLEDENIIKETKIIITKAPLFDEEGSCIGICGSFIDVTNLNIFPKFAELDDQHRFWLGPKFSNEYLTETELNVLKRILMESERGVAQALGISRGTVSTHVKNIKKKFQCVNIVGLRRLVIETGLIHELFSKNIIEQYVKQKSALSN